MKPTLYPPQSSGNLCSNFQAIRPLSAFNAKILLSCAKNTNPSWNSGVFCASVLPPVWNIQATFRSLALPSLIWVSVLYRCPPQLPLACSQESPGSFASIASVTGPACTHPARPASDMARTMLLITPFFEMWSISFSLLVVIKSEDLNRSRFQCRKPAFRPAVDGRAPDQPQVEYVPHPVTDPQAHHVYRHGGCREISCG